MNEKKHLDLFSGIGGFALASNRTGWETIAFCEKDRYCQAVLRRHWPSVPIHDDITKLEGAQFKGVDLLTGGFPCQPYSYAGNRRGAEDDRALWPEMLRIIEEARPRIVLGENVDGFVSMGLDNCLSDLEALKYAVWPIVIPACAVGAQHRRDRVWIIAHNESESAQETILEQPERREIYGKPRGNSNASEIQSLSWEANQPSMVGMAYGLSGWVDRSRAIGNAIVPQVAEEILRSIQ